MAKRSGSTRTNKTQKTKFYSLENYIKDCFINFLNDIAMYSRIVYLDQDVKCNACANDVIVFKTNRKKGDKLAYLGRCNCCRHMQNVYLEVA